MESDIGSNYYIRSISKTDYDNFREEFEPKIFPNRFDIHISQTLTKTEQEKVDLLGKKLGTPFERRTGFFYKSQLIGWSYGYQISSDTFRMATTGILQEHQRKGLYSAYLSRLTEELKSAGFQIVLSRHVSTDNQVIIPKLRFGFLITGFELTDDFGLLLRLSYYFNQTRRKAIHVRSGLQQPDEEVSKLIRKY